jgi:DNA transformation protein and related proteins
MDRPIAELKNLGASSARDLAAIGIETEAQLREIGVVEAWHRLNEHKPNSYTIAGLYALAGALENVVWTELPIPFREKLRSEAHRKPKRSRAPVPRSPRPAPQRPSVA